MFANNTNSTMPFPDLKPMPWPTILGVLVALGALAVILVGTVITLVRYQLREEPPPQGHAENIELSDESKVQPMQMEPIPQAILYQKEMQQINHHHSSSVEIILKTRP